MKKTAMLLALLASTSTISAWAQSAQPTSEEGASQDILVVGKFLDTGAKSAMKMDVPVLDTPFSVTSYSDAFVKSLETTNVSDLYNYMTGVKKAGNTAYDITLRGFKASGDDRNAIMVDGLPGLTGRFGSPPTIGVDHIELVKGPMSVLYGPIQPGGFVNLVTKKPQATSRTEVNLRGITYAGAGIDAFDRNSYDIALDSTGSVTKDGALLYRVVLEWSDRTLFRDFSGDRSKFAMPSVTWAIGPATTVTAQFEYHKVREKFDTGLVAPESNTELIAPITTRYQEPNNFREEEGTAKNLFFNHAFSDKWKFNLNFRNVDYSSSQQEYSPITVVKKTFGYIGTRKARDLYTGRSYRYLDTNIVGEFNTWGLKHKLLIGFNAGKDKINNNRIKFFNSSTSNSAGVCPNAYCFDIDIYNPVYGKVPDVSTLPATNPTLNNQSGLLTNQFFYTKSLGLYISDLVTVTDWLKVSLSARAFREKQHIVERRVVGTPEQRKTAERAFLPSAGVLVQPIDHLSIYGSYAQSFVPADPGAQDITGSNPFKPVESSQIEMGFKTENLLAGLTTTVALYRIKQDGILNSFNCPTGATIDGVLVTASGNCYLPIGKTQSKGIEIEGNYSPIKNWQIAAGYTFIDARITATNIPVQLNQRLQNVARNAANLWTRYDFPNGLGLGFGVTYTGQREGALGATQLNLPAYTLVDAGIYYTTGGLSLSLKGGNLFDEQYLESSGQGANGRLQIAAGAPRNLVLSLRYAF